MASSPNFAERIKRLAAAAGFDLCGIVSAEEQHSPELEYFKQWIADGHAGEMEYLKSRNEQGELKRSALRNAVPWVKSVVVCAINYNADEPYSIEMSGPDRGWISRYAWFRYGRSGEVSLDHGTAEKATADYHNVILRRLREVEAGLQQDWHQHSQLEPMQTRCYVDTGPLVERVYAKYAGIGWTGKNTCTINEKIGSWIFLGVILTSLDASQLSGSRIETAAEVAGGDRSSLPFDMPASDRCGSCTRCIDACPTGALVEPYQMDARKCIAYLTIEKRGAIPEELRAQMGHHIFGCDICQDVCPWNFGYKHSSEDAIVRGRADKPQPDSHRAPVASAVEFEARPELVHPPLRWLASMSREEFNSVFRSSPVKRAKFEGIRRNTAVVMGNSGNQKFIPDLEKLAVDEDTNVAEHARWALERLRSGKSQQSN